MGNIVFTNNASALLATTIVSGDTEITLEAGFGALFPNPSGAQYFLATLEDNAGNFEIVRCTGRAGDVLTVVRGQDNTSAQNFTAVLTRVELRLTAGVVLEMLQKSGDTMTGDLDMDGNSIIDAVILGSGTSIQGGEIVNVPLRGDSGLGDNEIVVPPGGGPATSGGSEILTADSDLIAALDTAGVILLDSATIGVRIPDNAYLRIEGAAPGEYGSIAHNDTDLIFAGVGTERLVLNNFSEGLALGGSSARFDMAGGELQQSRLIDFDLVNQSVAAATSLDIDYLAGAYVTVNMNADVTNLEIINIPTAGYVPVRLKLVQGGAGGFVVTNWPTGILWPSGVAPTLSLATGEIDFVDLWTDDGGTTWYGSFNTDWS